MAYIRSFIFQHNTFFWEGIDGSQVLTHFPPADSYVMQGKASEMHHSLENFKDKGRSNVGLYLYGHGDGGQGPKWVIYSFSICDVVLNGV